MQFWQNKVAITADVEGAFLLIALATEEKMQLDFYELWKI